jgi:hypothetical protein
VTDAELAQFADDCLRNGVEDDFLLRGFAWSPPAEFAHLDGQQLRREFQIAKATRRNELAERLPDDLRWAVREFYYRMRRGV